ncbi:MAG: NUDIX domain-containing protein [Desulfomonilia bacterium]
MKFCPECGRELTIRMIDGRQRQACSSGDCQYVFWNNPVPIVAAVVSLDGDVILVRNKTWPEKMFGLVSGFLEQGETPEQAVVREVREELGLECETAEFIGYYSFFEMNQLILAFHVQTRGCIILGDELSEFRRVHPDKLKPWPFGTGYAVADWLARRTETHPG